MLKIIIAKEIKETLGTIKFGLTFGLCAIMIILAFYIGARNYQVQMRQYEAAKAENIRQMEGITDWAMIKHHVILPPSPLHALVNGISNVIVQEGLYDDEFVDRKTDNFSELLNVIK